MQTQQKIEEILHKMKELRNEANALPKGAKAERKRLFESIRKLKNKVSKLEHKGTNCIPEGYKLGDHVLLHKHCHCYMAEPKDMFWTETYKAQITQNISNNGELKYYLFYYDKNGHEVLEALTDKKEISPLWANASMFGAAELRILEEYYSLYVDTDTQDIIDIDVDESGPHKINVQYDYAVQCLNELCNKSAKDGFILLGGGTEKQWETVVKHHMEYEVFMSVFGDHMKAKEAMADWDLI